MKNQFWAKAKSDKAELYLYDQIGKNWYGEGITATTVKEALDEFTPKSTIDIYINSPGGDVFDGIAIYNLLNRWAGKKIVHIDGIAASIASVIAMVGEERNMAMNATFMCHRSWSMCMGNAKDMHKYAESLEVIDGTIIDTYMGGCSISKAEIETLVDAETWMNADTALKYGFVTKKTGENKTAKAEFPLLAKFNKVPDHLRRQVMATNVLLARANARTMNIKDRRPAGKTA